MCTCVQFLTNGVCLKLSYLLCVHAFEMQFNCCAIHHGVSRTRNHWNNALWQNFLKSLQ